MCVTLETLDGLGGGSAERAVLLEACSSALIGTGYTHVGQHGATLGTHHSTDISHESFLPRRASVETSIAG